MTTTTMPHSSPAHADQDADALAVMRVLFRSTLMAFGIACPPELEQAFADRAVNSLGGEQLYFPRAGSQRKKQVHEWVRANWRGDNVRELARVSGLSERRIRQLVASEARK